MDCYRTWESILFGAIPIVRNSTLLPLWQKSPVYVLNDWSHPIELEDLLMFQLKTINRDIILAQYWIDKINADREIQPILETSINELWNNRSWIITK